MPAHSGTPSDGPIATFAAATGCDVRARNGVSLFALRPDETRNPSGGTGTKSGRRLQNRPTGTDIQREMASSADCRAEPGAFAPVVDRGKCEGKADCAAVCPFHVFEVRRIDDGDFAKLGMWEKLKSIVHGRMTAYTPLSSACQACGKCVAACPETAIKLARAGS